MWFLIVVYIAVTLGGIPVVRGDFLSARPFKTEQACYDQLNKSGNLNKFRHSSSIEFICLEVPTAI